MLLLLLLVRQYNCIEILANARSDLESEHDDFGLFSGLCARVLSELMDHEKERFESFNFDRFNTQFCWWLGSMFGI